MFLPFTRLSFVVGFTGPPDEARETGQGTAMITFIRTSSIAPGKVVEALTFAHQIAALVEKITGVKIGVTMPIGSGNPFRIAWVAMEADLGAFEATTAKVTSNSEYMKLVESSASYFLPGSAHDELWRSA